MTRSVSSAMKLCSTPANGERTSTSPTWPTTVPTSMVEPSRSSATGVKMPAAGLTTSRSTAKRCSPSCWRGPDGGAGADPFEQLVEVLGRGDRDRAASRDGPFGHAGQHRAGAELGEVGHAGVGEREQGVLPAHRARQLRRQQARPVGRPGRAAVHRRSTRPGRRCRVDRPRRAQRAGGRVPRS